MAKTKYPTLLSPAKIGNVEIRNRTIMAAMGMSQSDNGFVNKATILPDAVYEGYTVGNQI